MGQNEMAVGVGWGCRMRRRPLLLPHFFSSSTLPGSSRQNQAFEKYLKKQARQIWILPIWTRLGS